MRTHSVFTLCLILSLQLTCVTWGQDRTKAAKSAVPPKPAEKKEPVKKEPVAPAAKQPEVSPDETAIRQNAASFVKLYNAHDVKGLLALFTPRAEMIDESGKMTKGREAIEQALTKEFKDTPEASMEIAIDAIRVLSSDLAVEEGYVSSKDSPSAREEITAYSAIHAKVDGKWLLVSVRDWGLPPALLTPHDRLQELAWLLGDWVEESADSVVRSSCKWHDNGNFLMQEFNVHVGGTIAMSGTVRIGWDAVRKQFKSWVFDSHGGQSEGYWTRDNDQWVVKMQGATAKGEAASATNIYRPLNAETVVWKSIDRLIDGENSDHVGPITLKRRPPAPTE